MIQQRLQQTCGQQLQLTPKLQQAIRMLQLSSQELTQELMHLLESNIMLELDEQFQRDTPISQLKDEDAVPTDDERDNQDLETAPYELYQPLTGPTDNLQTTPRELTHKQDDLRHYLLWQLRASQFSDLDYAIGEVLIDAINEEGFLTENLTAIQTELRLQHKPTGLEQIQYVLSKIHDFDPIGVGAKDLQETLLLQLNAQPAHTPYLAITKSIIQDHLPLLANHHYDGLLRACHISRSELSHALQLIKTLHPRPGSAHLSKDESNYILPDIITFRKGRVWQVKLNPFLLPKLRLNQPYLSLLETSQYDINHQYIHHHLREAKWLIQCVKQRNDTLLRVASCIVKHQQAFMTHGVGAMKALILKDIATECDLHQSTISRVSTQKFIQTPQGTFELKYFFSSHINTDYEQSCSALAIQAFIKELIQTENHQKPLSDHSLAVLLATKGLNIARRTVSKYRELLRIPTAAQRKAF